MIKIFLRVILASLLLASFGAEAVPVVQIGPTPIQRFVDNNGNALANGKLFTYIAGTNTKQTTYTDSTGSTPNTNPVILNSRGEANVWLDTSKTYKLVLSPQTDSDPPTNSIWTVDNLPGGYASSVNLSSTIEGQGIDLVGRGVKRLASYTEAHNLTAATTVSALLITSPDGGVFRYDPTDTTSAEDGGGFCGTVIVDTAGKRWKRFAGDWSLAWFGVNGLVSSSQDTTGIVNAFAAATTYITNTGLGVTFKIPSLNTFGLTQSFTIPKNVTLDGAGRTSTVFNFTNTGDGFKTVSPVNSSTAINVSLKNIGITNNNAANTGAGYDDVGGTFISVENVRISGFKYQMILDQSEIVTIRRCDFEGSLANSHGIWLVNGTDHTPLANMRFTNTITIADNQFNSGGTGIAIIDDGGINHTYLANDINGFASYGRFADALGLNVIGGEYEQASGTPWTFTNVTFNSATVVGPSDNVKLEGFEQVATGAVMNVVSLGTIALDTMTLNTSAANAITGGANIYSLSTRAILSNASGGFIDAFPTRTSIQSSFMGPPYSQMFNYSNLPQVFTKSLVPGRSQLTFSASISVDSSLGNTFTVSATSNTNTTLNNPVNPSDGQEIRFIVYNISGGAMGTVSFGTSYKTTAAFTTPANGFNRAIAFVYNANSALWYEVSRSTADCPN